jgi:hypothetical protein
MIFFVRMIERMPLDDINEELVEGHLKVVPDGVGFVITQGQFV